MNELSIVVICLTSVDKLPEFMDELAVYIMGNPSDIETIIVTHEKYHTNNSIADYVKKKYPWLKFRMLQKFGASVGYGALVRLGLAYSASRYAVLVSPYGEDDIGIITKMLAMIRKGTQVIQVTRYALPEDAETVQLRSRIYQAIYRFFTRLLLGHKISDSTYAFKMFDRIFIQALGLTQNGRSISPEITIKAILAEGKVEYLPSGVRPRQIGSRFKLHKDGLGYIWLLIRGLGHRMKLFPWF